MEMLNPENQFSITGVNPLKEPKIDDIDRKIINLLIDNGRLSYVELAEEVGLSRVAVRERVNQLLEAGVIEKFTVVVDSEKFGKTVSAFFEIEVEPSSLEKVALELAENPNVASIYQMTGPSTLHTHVLVDNNMALQKFINENLYALPGILRVESQILLKRYKSRTGMKL
jgi:DNA-binding Lrp family transcriptional regulator